MRVLVCGSRTFEDRAAVAKVLFGESALRGDDPDMVVIEGGARGADAHAAEWAKNFATGHERYPADWQTYGKAAGPIRNIQMLDEGKPDVVWAFVDKPIAKSRGTHHMVLHAHEAGVPTYVVQAYPKR